MARSRRVADRLAALPWYAWSLLTLAIVVGAAGASYRAARRDRPVVAGDPVTLIATVIGDLQSEPRLARYRLSRKQAQAVLPALRALRAAADQPEVRTLRLVLRLRDRLAAVLSPDQVQAALADAAIVERRMLQSPLAAVEVPRRRDAAVERAIGLLEGTR